MEPTDSKVVSNRLWFYDIFDAAMFTADEARRESNTFCDMQKIASFFLQHVKFHHNIKTKNTQNMSFLTYGENF